MSTWIELHDTCRDHPKIIKLARDLGIPQVYALGHLTSLWSWAARMAPDGCLASFDHEDIEIGAQWSGEPGVFVASCVARRLLDERDGALWIHDAREYGGSAKAAARAKASRERKAAEEAVARAEQQALCARVRTRANSCATVPNCAGTDQTDQTDQTDRSDRHIEACAELVPRSAPAALVEVEEAVVWIPLAGGKASGITRQQIEEWTPAYPGIDVETELRKAKAWCEANPQRRKTARGVKAFLVSWLSRAQDSGRGARASPVSTRETFAAQSRREAIEHFAAHMHEESPF